MRGPPHRNPHEPREQLPAVEGTIADAAELVPGDRVVYPNQGVCAVTGFEEKDIAGQKLEFVRMRREEDGAAVLVPRNKVASVGLRRVATGEQMEGVFHYLGAVFDDPELDWKVRHRDNADRLGGGGILGVAEVVKGLHSLSRLRPLPTKERETYDNARHLLVHEISVSLGVPPGLAEDYVDFALMPPAGVKLALKPPPRPVMVASRPKKRRPVAEDSDDLGLDDLGLGDLGIEGAEGEEREGGDREEAGAGEEAVEAPAAAAEAARPAAKAGKSAPTGVKPPAGKKEAAPSARKPAAKKAPAKRARAPVKAAAKRPTKKPAAAAKGKGKRK